MHFNQYLGKKKKKDNFFSFLHVSDTRYFIFKLNQSVGNISNISAQSGKLSCIFQIFKGLQTKPGEGRTGVRSLKQHDGQHKVWELASAVGNQQSHSTSSPLLYGHVQSPRILYILRATKSQAKRRCHSFQSLKIN